MDPLSTALLQLSPTLTTTELSPLAALPPALLSALVHLAQAYNPSTSPTRLVLLAEKKATSLRTSLSHLTAHLQALSTRLASSEAQLAAVEQARVRELGRVKAERDGLRALCGVWEGRWREERRLREDGELEFGKLVGKGRGRTLNERTGRAETTLVGPRDGWRPLAHHASRTQHRSSSDSDSSSSSSAHTHRTTSHSLSYSTTPSNNTHEHQYANSPPDVTPTPAAPRLRTRQVVADLARELERVRREADRLLFERDEEITRLEAEQRERRKELAGLYGSLDTLLGMGGNGELKSRETGAETETEALPELRGANKSSAVDPARRKQSSKAAQLEAEVRELEREIERMGGDYANRDAAQVLADSVGRGDAADPTGPEDRASLAQTVMELNRQVDQLRASLEALSHEREVLQQLYEGEIAGSTTNKGKGKASQPTESTEDLATSLSALQADRDHLAHLLHLSNTSNHDLSVELSTTQSDIELVSARVRQKLVEQKSKLAECHLQMEQLLRELEDVEARLDEALARATRAEDGWERERRKCGVLETMVRDKSKEGSDQRAETGRKERKTERSRSD